MFKTNLLKKVIGKKSYRYVPNYNNNYIVTEDGMLYSFKYSKWRWVKGHTDKSGCHVVALTQYGSTKAYYMHYLMAICFGELDRKDVKVLHKNYDKTDNRLQNLIFLKNDEQYSIAEEPMVDDIEEKYYKLYEKDLDEVANGIAEEIKKESDEKKQRASKVLAELNKILNDL